MCAEGSANLARLTLNSPQPASPAGPPFCADACAILGKELRSVHVLGLDKRARRHGPCSLCTCMLGTAQVSVLHASASPIPSPGSLSSNLPAQRPQWRPPLSANAHARCYAQS